MQSGPDTLSGIIPLIFHPDRMYYLVLFPLYSMRTGSLVWHYSLHIQSGPDILSGNISFIFHPDRMDDLALFLHIPSGTDELSGNIPLISIKMFHYRESFQDAFVSAAGHVWGISWKSGMSTIMLIVIRQLLLFRAICWEILVDSVVAFSLV